MKSVVFLLSACVSLVGLPAIASACGGLFCATPPPLTAPEPVDQTAERIIFEVDEGEITAHIQIQYAGEADDFAWVVPFGAVPGEIVESDDQLFADLDSASALQVILPPQDPCQFTGSDDSGGCGIGCSSDDAAMGTAAGEGASDGTSPVTVYDHNFTENFEYHTVGAENTQDLVDWLQDNGYNVSDNMTPVMDLYNGTDSAFVALKLQADRDASDINPIAITYEGTHPSIPIQLTAVAAQPLMGILVFIVADVPYAPANYVATPPVTSEILHDDTGVTSYFEWVARETDEAGGQFFSTEYVGDAFFGGRSRILSRYYTRMSPHMMTLDPVFDPHTDVTFRQSSLLDLSFNGSLWECGVVVTERIPNDCAFNYCGADSACTILNGTAACICDAGDVAQSITGPDGGRYVTCIPEENPYGVTAVDGGAGTEFDPCVSSGCGSGTCVLRGGFPTCECPEGTVAVLTGTGDGVICSEVDGTVTTYGPGAGTEAAPTVVSARGIRVETTSARWATAWLPLALVAIGLGLARRRLS